MATRTFTGQIKGRPRYVGTKNNRKLEITLRNIKFARKNTFYGADIRFQTDLNDSLKAGVKLKVREIDEEGKPIRYKIIDILD